MEDVDEPGFKIATVHEPSCFVLLANDTHVVQSDHVSRHSVARETKSDELFELLDARSAANLVVVTIERKASRKVPAGPETAKDRAKSARNQRRYESRPTSETSEHRRQRHEHRRDVWQRQHQSPNYQPQQR